MNPLIIIPARLAATRLPNKPLADIHGMPMIVHVWQRAVQAGIGRVVVAAGDQAIVEAVIQCGGEAVLTNPALPSGTDRVYAAAQMVDPANTHPIIINVQGDLPNINPQVIKDTYQALAGGGADIATPVVLVPHDEGKDNSSVVKAIAEMPPGVLTSRAYYFTRASAPYGKGPYLHHLGVYAYKREALNQFVAAAPSLLEQRENLEQLRALALGLRIDVTLVNDIPQSVDTPADLEIVRALMAKASA